MFGYCSHREPSTVSQAVSVSSSVSLSLACSKRSYFTTCLSDLPTMAQSPKEAQTHYHHNHRRQLWVTRRHSWWSGVRGRRFPTLEALCWSTELTGHQLPKLTDVRLCGVISDSWYPCIELHSSPLKKSHTKRLDKNTSTLQTSFFLFKQR